MKVAVFTDSCLPYCSGVTYAAISQVRELCRRGHDVQLFRPKPGKRYRLQQVDIPSQVAMWDVPFTLPAPRLPELRLVIPTVITTMRRLRRDPPDLVHVHTEWGCGWEGLIAAKLLRRPVVGTFHTFFADPSYLESLRLPKWRWIQKVVWAYAVTFFSQCDAVTSPSEAVRDSLLENGLAERPILISNGVAQTKLLDEQQIAALRQSYGIDGPSFVYVGRIAPEKSMDVLIDAFRLVRQRIPNAKLVVIGDGPMRLQIEQQIRATDLTDAVISLGFVSHQELLERNLLRLGDAFVTASTTENQPLSVLEAMVFGLPVIGPRAKGLREMILDGENGISFEANDIDGMAESMLRFNSLDTLERQFMSRASIGYAEQHSLCASIDKLIGLYSSLTGLNGSPSKTTNVSEDVKRHTLTPI